MKYCNVNHPCVGTQLKSVGLQLYFELTACNYVHRDDRVSSKRSKKILNEII